MAAPNIAALATMTGKVEGLAVTTSATAIVTNASGSNSVYKINSLLISNISVSAANITVELVKNSATAYRILYQVVVPSGASLDVLNKFFYLEENDSVRLIASANTSLEAVCSYEVIA
jgi:hypothetical protein